MLKQLVTATILASMTSIGLAQQTSIVFQDGLTPLPGGGFYDGTVDNEFRAANPTTSQSTNENISIDDFDGGFQTQAAIRFENLLISDGGAIPDGAPILRAELGIWVTSPTAQDAIININPLVADDTTSGDVWGNDDTWASLGGDLIPDAGGFLDGDPILEDGTEASATPDAIVAGPGSIGDPAAFAPQRESQNVMNDLLAPLRAELGEGESLTQAQIDNAVLDSFYRFDVTNTVTAWLDGSLENRGWSINNNTGNGWDMFSSEFSVSAEGGRASEADGGDPFGLISDNSAGEEVVAATLRPFLNVIFATGIIIDLNENEEADLGDYNAFLDLLGSELDSVLAAGAPGDFDFDRDVDLDDFAFFKSEFDRLNGAGALAAALAIPEPTSALLLAFCGLAAAKRRR